MMVAMDFDLNMLPVPEEEDKQTLESDQEQISTMSPNLERTPFGVDIARNENQERHKRMRLEQCADRSELVQMQTSISQPPPAPRTRPENYARSHDISKLPSGWLDCPPFGQDIHCMIPSKVPLDQSYNRDVPPGKRYSFKQVFKKQRHLSRKLGLVIDLTSTSRYYPTSDLVKEGIRHIKIPCKGRDSVPENHLVNRFVYEAIRFARMYPNRYILVHCTHGHNRTGYMIIHYLMRTLPMHTVIEAIQTFAKARPPGIYKPDYIDALYSFYHERKPAELVCPPTPEWKRSSELVPDGGIHQCSAAQLNESHQDMDTDIMTNDDTLGDEIPPEQQEELRLFCCQTLNQRGKYVSSRFPGAHPVSLGREKLQLLRQRYYYATWKADGTRYMMLITKDGCYLIDRKFNFRRVQMRFPCKRTNGLARNGHHYTLLDGEMVIDTEPGSQKKQRRYLIYDMMAINNCSVVKLPFHKRWKMVEEEVVQPRNEQRRVHRSTNNPNYRYDLEPFTVRRKGFWLLHTVEKLLKEFIPKLPNDADGIIFQGWDDSYVQGADEGLLKWKYPAMNSIDFLFEVGGDGRQQLFLNEKGQNKLMDGYRIRFNDSVDSFYFGKILECSWDSETREWVYMRTRTDKSSPNDINTHNKIMQSIKDNITEEVLLNEINKIIRLPTYVHKIQKDSKAAEKQTSSAR
ncbi:uncharacterized protein LOC126795288 [Argentina anserina]|uniref:uncharacterized protein LOC126795288 n=1 Tax=Argentina anserina TaxID=57926 RepID=UPI00217681B0|nr:uncharacterized protein LOC126795288 [Potentilla anserina]